MILACDLEFTQVARVDVYHVPCAFFLQHRSSWHTWNKGKGTQRYDSNYCTPPVMRQRDPIYRSHHAVARTINFSVEPTWTARPTGIALRRPRGIICDRKCISDVERCSALKKVRHFAISASFCLGAQFCRRLLRRNSVCLSNRCTFPSVRNFALLFRAESRGS